MDTHYPVHVSIPTTYGRFMNVTWLKLQIILQFLGFIISISFINLDITNRYEAQFNTLESRRVGKTVSRGKINQLFITQCLLPWLYGVPMIIVCITTIAGINFSLMLLWPFGVVLLPIWTAYTPIHTFIC